MRAFPSVVALLAILLLAPHVGDAAGSVKKDYVAFGVALGVDGTKAGAPLVLQNAPPMPLDAPASATFTLASPASAVSIMVIDAVAPTTGWGMCIVWDAGTVCHVLTESHVDSILSGELGLAPFPAGARVLVYVYSASTNPTRSIGGFGTTGSATMWTMA